MCSLHFGTGGMNNGLDNLIPVCPTVTKISDQSHTLPEASQKAHTVLVTSKESDR